MATDVLISQGLTGVQNQNDGSFVTQRMGKQGEEMVSQLHGRFYEQNYRGNVYGLGISNTALTSLNAIATGLTATATPVVGCYNPIGSGVNLVILKAFVVQTTIANTAVSPGGFMWCGATGQTVSTGLTPFNFKSLSKNGAQGQAFTMTTVMTGLAGSVVAMRGSPIGCINAAGPGTAISQLGAPTSEEPEGLLICPPGGVLGLFNQVSTTTVSLTVGIVWEEVPV